MSTTYAKPVLNVSVTTTEYESESRYTLSEALELFRGDSDSRVVDDVVTKKVEAWLLDDINDFGEVRFEAALERIALTDPLRAIAIERYILAWSLKHGKVIADLQLAKNHYEKQIKELGRMKSMHPLGKLCFKLFLASRNFLRDLLTRTLTEELEEKYSLAMDRQIAKQELERFVLQLTEIKQQTNQEQQKANAIMIQASNERRKLIELANKEYLAMTTQSRRDAEDINTQVRGRLEQKIEQEEARFTRLRETNARLESIKSDHLSEPEIIKLLAQVSESIDLQDEKESETGLVDQAIEDFWKLVKELGPFSNISSGYIDTDTINAGENKKRAIALLKIFYACVLSRFVFLGKNCHGKNFKYRLVTLQSRLEIKYGVTNNWCIEAIRENNRDKGVFVNFEIMTVCIREILNGNPIEYVVKVYESIVDQLNTNTAVTAEELRDITDKTIAKIRTRKESSAQEAFVIPGKFNKDCPNHGSLPDDAIEPCTGACGNAHQANELVEELRARDRTYSMSHVPRGV